MIASQDRWNYTPVTHRVPGTWPGGKKLAVYLCLGIEDYRFGSGHTENILPDIPEPDLANTSWRDYGNRVGAFRLLDRLDSVGISPAILLNTAVYDSAPDVMNAARRVGAEIVGHGVTNSDSLAGMTPADERNYLERVAHEIRSREGRAPGGWSSPWLTHTASTIDLLAAVGYDYLLDLRLDDQPVWLRTQSAPLLSIPYNLELNDSSSIIGRNMSALEFADAIVDEFDELLRASHDAPLVMSIVVHSFISGAPFRLRALTRALEHISQHTDDVWLTRPRDIHSFVVSRPSEFPLPTGVDQ